jgi:hypothetical protein
LRNSDGTNRIDETNSLLPFGSVWSELPRELLVGNQESISIDSLAIKIDLFFSGREKMKIAQPELHFENPVTFFASLKISFRFGMKLVDRGILVPDAEVNGKALFLADALSRERHRQKVVNYRATLREARENLVSV